MVEFAFFRSQDFFVDVFWFWSTLHNQYHQFYPQIVVEFAISGLGNFETALEDAGMKLPS